MRTRAPMSSAVLRFGAVLLAVLFTTGILLLAGAPPLEAYRQILVGSLGSVKKITDVLVAWVPLLLATSGLLVTFAAGLWNIGIEGQITLGAIFATGALRLTWAAICRRGWPSPCAILAGIAGGRALGAAGRSAEELMAESTRSSAASDSISWPSALTVWLIFGPWKPAGRGVHERDGAVPRLHSLPTLSGLRLSSVGPSARRGRIPARLLTPSRHHLRLAPESRRQEPSSSLLARDPDWQLHAAGFRPVRGAREARPAPSR